MGTDIHAAIERWISKGKEPARWRFYSALELGRNYDLFAILAGVRRSHEPIAEPRGLPTDLDPESCTKPWHKDPTHPYHNPKYGCPGPGDCLGDHSYSHLYLSELRAYDWDKRLIDSGVIPLRDVDRRDALSAGYTETYATWIQSPPHPPEAWCGGLSSVELLDLRPREFLIEDLSHIDKGTRDAARRVLKKREIDEAKAQRYLADPRLFPDPEEPPPGALIRRPGMTHGWLPGKNNPLTAWARVAWSITARELCAEFYAWLDKTKALPGDETRLVFGFDS